MSWVQYKVRDVGSAGPSGPVQRLQFVTASERRSPKQMRQNDATVTPLSPIASTNQRAMVFGSAKMHTTMGRECEEVKAVLEPKEHDPCGENAAS